MAKLVINPTSASKKEIPIASRVISIGRDPSNDLVLSDSMVSRRHAILEQRDDIYVLRDNNSSNGTLVNGDKVDAEKTLRDGDLVAIGSSRLLFQLEEGAASPLTQAPADDVEVGEGEDGAGPASSEAARSESINCPSCGKMALKSDRFCRACGAELEKKTSVACTACGTVVPLPADFCSNCGNALPKQSRAAALATRAHRRSELMGEDPPEEASLSKPSQAPRRPRSAKPGAGAREDEPAGFAIRLVAAIIDNMILGIPLLVATLVWGTFMLNGRDGGVPQASINAVLAGFPLICVAYYVVFWAVRGATPGKALLGLVIEDDDGENAIGIQRAAVRMVGYLVSSLILGLGFVMIAFSDDKRALHDRIAGTRVMRNL